MNEAETRAELIDPKLKAGGWGVIEGSKVLREYPITAGKIQTHGGRARPLIADYVLVYQGRKLAVIEAKSDELEVGEGVAQAKNYAEKMRLDTTFEADYPGNTGSAGTSKNIYMPNRPHNVGGAINRVSTTNANPENKRDCMW